MIKIAIPNYPFLEPILKNTNLYSNSDKIKIFSVNPNDCFELFSTNKVDLALFTPLDYGKIIKSADVRIIPNSCYAVEGFSGIFSFYFISGLDTINKCPTPINDDYLSIVFKMLLAEKYDIQTELIKSNQKLNDLISEFKYAFHYGNYDEIAQSMDLSEEWFDGYESILPICFWVCRNEEAPENIDELIESFVANPNQDHFHVNKKYDFDDEYREGKIYLKWSDEIENSLENILDLLYYYMYIPEIPEVKILGENYEQEIFDEN